MSLITSRRLGPLCLTQTCGAFNDNLVKNAMIVLAIFKLGAGGAGLAALAGALFIAPYALLSATAGQLADRFDKSRLIQATKAAEVLLMAGRRLRVPRQQRPRPAGRPVRSRRAGDDVRTAEIRHPAGPSARRRTGRRQRTDRGIDLPRHPGRNRGGRCAGAAGRRPGDRRRRRRRRFADRPGRRVRCPERPGGGQFAAHRLEHPPRNDRRHPPGRRRTGRSGCRSSA